jgi:hypothetical protein
MINARINTMRSNSVSIQRIDPALVPLLGFNAKISNLKLPKDLSTSNAVTVNSCLVTYPCRPNAGITLPHKR